MLPAWAAVATRPNDGLRSVILVICKATSAKQYFREFKLVGIQPLAGMKADTFGTTWPVLSQLSCTFSEKS
eukprot:788637-Amphidinium_carterae.2